MCAVATISTEEELLAGMCNDLFREWSVDLDVEEKKVWLWNALVEMHRIKKRKG